MKKISFLTLLFLVIIVVPPISISSSNNVFLKILLDSKANSHVWQIAETVYAEKIVMAKLERINSLATINQSQQVAEKARGHTLNTVDFANFAYPTTKEVAQITGQSKITLNRGNTIVRNNSGDILLLMGLSHVFKGDVTGGDDVEDAIVILTYSTGGTGISECVYVFTKLDNVPKLLWSFNTGDRSDGGLRNVYSENGNLVVETFNSEGLGACCTKSFTKSVYKWNGEKFHPFKSTKLSNPSGAASPIYNGKSKND